jgi:hypothetical protein
MVILKNKKVLGPQRKISLYEKIARGGKGILYERK